MKWLITGASGLLGQHIQQLISSNDQQTGWYLRNPIEDSVQVDIRNKTEVEAAMSDEFDLCIHCAADPNIVSCEDDPKAAWELNVNGTQNVVDASVQHKIVPQPT